MVGVLSARRIRSGSAGRIPRVMKLQNVT